MSISSRFPLLALAFVVASTGQSAEATAPADQAAIKLDPFAVTSSATRTFSIGLTEANPTGSRLGLTALQTPASIEVLDGDLLRARGDTTLSEAVTRATGLIDLGAPGNGSSSLGARGFTGHGSVMQLVDGTRLYVASGTLTFPFDPWMIERVEILHGPASVLFGDAATGAAINYLAKKPLATAASRVSASYGTDQTHHVGLDTGGPLGAGFSYRATLSQRASDTSQLRNRTESLGVGAAVRWELNPQFSTTLAYDGADRDPSHYFGTPLINGRLDQRLDEQNFNVADSFINYRDHWLRLDSVWTPTAQLTLRHQLYRLTSDRHWRNLENYTWNATTARVARSSAIEIIHDQAQEGTRLDATWRDEAWQALLGFEGNRIDFAHTNNSPFAGGDTVDPFAFAPGNYASPNAFGPGFNTQTRQRAFFGEGRVTLSPTWSLVAGGRVDHVALDRTDRRVAASSFARDYDFATGRIGVVYAATPTASLYAQFVTGADPAGGALITTATAQSAFDLSESRQFEAGAKASLPGGRGELSLALFEVAKTNLLTRDPSNPALTVQIGEQSTRGFEANAAFNLGHGWRLGGNFAWLDATYDAFTESVGGLAVSRVGNRPINVPEFTANLDVGWTFLSGWTAAALLRHVGERFSDNANTRTVPAYSVVDCRLHWQITKRWAATARVANLLDERYATTTGNSGNQWLLGRSRSTELTLDLAW
jgi:iron complex outermembrane receptor protein